jgi:hypothetical protein
MNTVDEGFKGSTQGFIAYIKISDLFSGQNNFQYNYSRVPTTTHVNKIKTYYEIVKNHPSRGYTIDILRK